MSEKFFISEIFFKIHDFVPCGLLSVALGYPGGDGVGVTRHDGHLQCMCIPSDH